MKKGLGKGLEALFGNDIEETIENTIDAKALNTGLLDIKLSQIDINREQPRKNFDEEKIKQLAESIKEDGLVQPIIVAKTGNRYKIIAGERRFRAAKVAGLSTISAIVRDDNLDDKKLLELALIENIQRQDLNPIEEGMAIKSLINEYSMTQDMVAKKLGRSRPAITNTIRLLNLDKRVQAMLINGDLSEAQARSLVVIEDSDTQYKVACEVVKRGLNSRDVEELMRAKRESKKGVVKENVFAKDLEDRIKNYLGTKVKIVMRTKEKGKIVIEYMSNEDLDRIVNLFGLGE